VIRVLFFHSQFWVAEFFARLACSEEVEAWAANKVHKAKTLISARQIKYVVILPGTTDPELRFLQVPWWCYKIIHISEDELIGGAEKCAFMAELLKKICK
jgi:hypothetical protein